MPLPPLRLISLSPPDAPFVPGPASKPESCRNCRLYTTTTGLVLDTISPSHKIALVFLSPTADDVNARKPLSGNMGWFIRRTVSAAGLKESDYGVSYLFRCFADRAHRDNYGKLKISTVNDGFAGCRAYDWSSQDESGQRVNCGLRDWRPDVWLPTFEAEKGILVPTFALLTRGDLEKARVLAEEGNKVAVVFGSAAMKKVMGWTEDGGIKMWRGSAEYFTWEPKIDRVNVEVGPQVMFKDATGGRAWGLRKKRKR